jgi:CubicO group peptidase (beta-lactamase class C family)
MTDASLQDQFPRTRRIIKQGIEQGLHRGAQLYVSREGIPLLNAALGENVPGCPLEHDTLMLWLSAGKPITAAAILQRVEQGELELDQPIAATIPEFAQNGKERITLRDVLIHIAGLKPIVSGWPERPWDEIIAKICASGLKRDQRPGAGVGYDPARSWFILGEMLQRLDGRSVDRIIREDVLEPLGMRDSWLALPPHLHDAYGDRVGVSYTIKDGEFVPTLSHTAEVCAAPSPGGSMRGPISELGRFYEMLLRGGQTGDGKSLLLPQTVAQMTSRQREGLFDATFQHTLDFGLGVIVNSNRYGAETVPYGFGRHASEAAFGHGGAQSSIGFADPQHHLVVAAVANGFPGEELHNQRFRELCSAIYEDLNLAG